MAEGKNVNESLMGFTRLFVCSDDRIFIFGKTSYNFAEIIKAALNVDINCYANDTDNNLFVYKTSCYKWLLKFQRATEEVEEISKKIQDAFQARPKAKRMLRPSDGNDDEIRSTVRNEGRHREHYVFCLNQAEQWRMQQAKQSTDLCVNSYIRISREQLKGGINLFIIWLAPRAGKMTQIARCDWLPERARWSHLAHLGLPAVSRKKNFPESHIINPLLIFCEVKMAGYWPRSFFASLSTSTSSRSINTQKKNLANI